MEKNNLPAIKKENIIQKLFNKIKKAFQKEDFYNIEQDNNIQVDESVSNNIDSNKKFREENKINDNYINIEKGSLDYAIDQFVSSYYYNTMKTGRVDAYNSLINLGAMDIEPDDNNEKIERDLLNVLENSDKFRILKQENKNIGKTYFYHVRTNNYKINTNAQPMRIYINCRRKNVATLAGEMLSKMQDDNLYLKFSSDYQLGTKSRSEAIVVYTDSENANNILNAIGKIEQEKPELFNGSKNMNPFMNSIGNCSYVPDIEKNTKYINCKGKHEKLALSYNTFLSRALEECFVTASRSIIAKDKDLTLETNGVISNDPSFYMKYFEKIRETHYREFLNGMKQELRNAQKRNNCLDIKGINEEKGEMRNNEQQI